MAFYDTEATTGVLLQGLNEDTNGVQNATGEKVRWVWHCMQFTGVHLHITKDWLDLDGSIVLS